VKRPSLVLFPPFSTSLPAEQVAGIAASAERRLALTRAYEIVSLGFVEEFLVRTDPAFDKARLQPAGYLQAQELARELELDRFGVCWVYHGSSQWEFPSRSTCRTEAS
jgi:hypothetical protein